MSLKNIKNLFRHFDPYNIRGYAGKTIETSNSEYQITPAGRYERRVMFGSGRVLDSSGELTLIAGIDIKWRIALCNILGISSTGLSEAEYKREFQDSEGALKKFIAEHGKKPKRGLSLVLGLPENVRERAGPAIITTEIKAIR